MKKDNFCITDLKTTTEKFVWTIKHFSEHEEKCGECLESKEFISTAPNGQILKWELHIYPNGDKEEHKGYIAIFLCLIDSNNEEVKAKFQFSLRKCNGLEYKLKPMEKEWLKFDNSQVNAWGCKLIKREVLLNEKYGLIDGDRLTFECTVMVQQKSEENVPLPNVEVPECRIPEDLSHLFEQGLFTDCKITSEDNKEYKVHKCILGCRSPVFGAMFQHDMIEKNNNEVKIEDMKGDVIEKMLRFIYSGKEPDFGEMAEDLLMTIDLLKAANKYELMRLKLFCERKLINSLGMGSANACALLSLANIYSAENLKTHSIKFIKTHLKEVMKSDGWKEFADDELKDQILEATMEK